MILNDKILIRVRKTYAGETIRDDLYEEEGKERTVDDAHYKARYAVSRTVNLGNFESYRMEVDITAPCDEHSEVPELLDGVKGLALQKLKQYIEKAREEGWE